MDVVLPRRLVLADVGPLYAAVDPEDQYHAQARDEMRALDSAAIAIGVTRPTVAEAQSLVLKKLGPMVARRWLDDLLTGTRQLSVDAVDYLDAVALMRRFSDQRLTMFDC